MVTNREIGTSSVLYTDAVDFWTDWQEDPDADMKIDGSPSAAIESYLVEQGAVPAEAKWVSRVALDTVCDRKYR